jgi:hypothetical protein
MSKRIIETLNSRFSIVSDTVFNGQTLVDYQFVEDTYQEKLIVKISPNYNSYRINNTICGTNSDEKFYYINLDDGFVIILEQTICEIERINDRFAVISGSEACMLFDTVTSSFLDKTFDGDIQKEGNIIKVISSKSTRIYNGINGNLELTIPNL